MFDRGHAGPAMHRQGGLDRSSEMLRTDPQQIIARSKAQSASECSAIEMRTSSLRKNLEVEQLLSFLRVGSGCALGFRRRFWRSDRPNIYAATNFGMRIRL
jgi:hypothetical protein